MAAEAKLASTSSGASTPAIQTVPSAAIGAASTSAIANGHVNHKHGEDDPVPIGLSSIGEAIFRAIHCCHQLPDGGCTVPLMNPPTGADSQALARASGAFVRSSGWRVGGQARMRKCMPWMSLEQQLAFVALEHQLTPKQRKEDEDKKKKALKSKRKK